MIIKFKKLTETAKVPRYAHIDDAGMDIYSDENFVLKAGEHHLFKTGISSEIETGNVILIWDKSGLGSKGIKRFGGVIDSGYRGEWMVTLYNTNKEDYEIEIGDKIAQALIQKIEHPEIIEVSDLGDSERGESGFGSTGKK